jgi:transcriptional regulator with XRE-family HTH domain
MHDDQESSEGSGPDDSGVLRFNVGARLRRLREERGITRAEAAEAIRGSEPKISRMELGRVRIKERDAADLLTLYRVDATEREEILSLVKEAAKQQWWSPYRDVTPRWFESFLTLERAASRIRAYEAQFIPGLLQTAAYSHAVMELGQFSPADQQQRIDLRVRRQEVLSRDCPSGPCPPSLAVVMEQSVLRRLPVRPPVLREQLTYLVEMANRPTVTLQLVPEVFGGHATSGLSFTIMGFSQPSPPEVVYLEQLDSALYLDTPRDVARYTTAFDSLSAQVLTPRQTVTELEAAINAH